MADTTFVPGTVVASTWLNDVNDDVYGNNQRIAPLGSAGAPSYAVKGGLTTGMWFPSTTSISWATNGITHITLSATGLTTFAPTGGAAVRYQTLAGAGTGTYNIWNSGAADMGYIGCANQLRAGGAAADFGIRADGVLEFMAGGATLIGTMNTTGLGIGLVPAAKLQVLVANETGGGSNQGVSIVGPGSTRQMNSGVDTTNGYTWIQSWIPGSGAGNMRLQPSGGSILFGGSALVNSATNALGYTTGAGGVVTQATSKATGVTLNRGAGQITMNNANLATGASVVFVVTNSTMTRNDTVVINVVDDFGASYFASVVGVWDGYFNVRLTNFTGGDLAQAVRLNFSIIKGAIS